MATWHGKRCGSLNATFAGIGGYPKRRTRQIAPARSAARRCGTRAVLTAGREKHESRQVGAADRLARADDSASDCSHLNAKDHGK